MLVGIQIASSFEHFLAIWHFTWIQCLLLPAGEFMFFQSTLLYEFLGAKRASQYIVVFSLVLLQISLFRVDLVTLVTIVSLVSSVPLFVIPDVSLKFDRFVAKVAPIPMFLRTCLVLISVTSQFFLTGKPFWARLATEAVGVWSDFITSA